MFSQNFFLKPVRFPFVLCAPAACSSRRARTRGRTCVCSSRSVVKGRAATARVRVPHLRNLGSPKNDAPPSHGPHSFRWRAFCFERTASPKRSPGARADWRKTYATRPARYLDHLAIDLGQSPAAQHATSEASATAAARSTRERGDGPAPIALSFEQKLLAAQRRASSVAEHRRRCAQAAATHASTRSLLRNYDSRWLPLSEVSSAAVPASPPRRTVSERLTRTPSRTPPPHYDPAKWDHIWDPKPRSILTRPEECHSTAERRATRKLERSASTSALPPWRASSKPPEAHAAYATPLAAATTHMGTSPPRADAAAALTYGHAMDGAAGLATITTPSISSAVRTGGEGGGRGDEGEGGHESGNEGGREDGREDGDNNGCDGDGDGDGGGSGGDEGGHPEADDAMPLSAVESTAGIGQPQPVRNHVVARARPSSASASRARIGHAGEMWSREPAPSHPPRNRPQSAGSRSRGCHCSTSPATGHATPHATPHPALHASPHGKAVRSVRPPVAELGSEARTASSTAWSSLTPTMPPPRPRAESVAAKSTAVRSFGARGKHEPRLVASRAAVHNAEVAVQTALFAAGCATSASTPSLRTLGALPGSLPLTTPSLIHAHERHRSTTPAGGKRAASAASPG